MNAPIQRNVRIAGEGVGGRGRLVDRVLISHPWINAFARNSAMVALSLLVWPRFFAPYRWRLTRHDLPLANLRRAYEGYRILHLTDLHAGRTRQGYLLGVLDRCLDEKPDLIVITGDFIDYHPRSLAAVKVLLERLAARPAPDGIVAIFGNHDYHEYSWRHNGPRSARRIIHRRLAGHLQDAGIRILRNEHHRVGRAASAGDADGKDLVIAGLDELWTSLADPGAAFHGLGPADPIICLQHNPDGIDMLAPYPWQYMLCGHSHGGQARFPLLGAIYVPMEKRQYLSGHFSFPPIPGQPASLACRRMFVSRGLGHSTPIRFRCPPEASLLTVRCV